MEKINIEGAKLSQELITINIRHFAHFEKILSRFCRDLSDNQINMQFLSTVHGDDEENQITCCVDSEAGDFIYYLFASEPELYPHNEVIEKTGLLTLFPHHFNLKLLGLVLNILGSSSLPLYGAGSSLSSLTFILDYRALERAIDLLRKKFEISPGKIERRPKIRIKQSRLMRPD